MPQAQRQPGQVQHHVLHVEEAVCRAGRTVSARVTFPVALPEIEGKGPLQECISGEGFFVGVQGRSGDPKIATPLAKLIGDLAIHLAADGIEQEAHGYGKRGQAGMDAREEQDAQLRAGRLRLSLRDEALEGMQPAGDGSAQSETGPEGKDHSRGDGAASAPAGASRPFPFVFRILGLRFDLSSLGTKPNERKDGDPWIDGIVPAVGHGRGHALWETEPGRC